PICSFFFSSRRRHTSSKRDWSSDVCSSDLAGGAQHHGELSAAQGEVRIVEGGGGADRAVGVTAVGVGDAHAVEAQRAGRAVRDGAVGVRGGGGGGHQFPPRASSGSTRVTRRVARTAPSRPITSTPATGSSTVAAEES